MENEKIDHFLSTFQKSYFRYFGAYFGPYGLKKASYGFIKALLQESCRVAVSWRGPFACSISACALALRLIFLDHSTRLLVERLPRGAAFLLEAGMACV